MKSSQVPARWSICSLGFALHHLGISDVNKLPPRRDPAVRVALAGSLPVAVSLFVRPLWPGLLPANELWFCPHPYLVKLLGVAVGAVQLLGVARASRSQLERDSSRSVGGPMPPPLNFSRRRGSAVSVLPAARAGLLGRLLHLNFVIA